MMGRLAWTGYAAAGCAVVRLPLHLYYGLGGTAGLTIVEHAAPAVPSVDSGQWASGAAPLRSMVSVLPDWLSPANAVLAWRATHLATALLLAAVAVLAVALVRPLSRQVPSPVLIVPAFVVIVAALGYVVDATVSLARPLVSGMLPSVPLKLFDGGGDLMAGWDRWIEADTVAGLTASMAPSRPERAVLYYTEWLGCLPSSYPLGGLIPLGPWALALGLLLGLAVAQRLNGRTARRIWSVALVLAVTRLAY